MLRNGFRASSSLRAVPIPAIPPLCPLSHCMRRARAERECHFLLLCAAVLEGGTGENRPATAAPAHGIGSPPENTPIEPDPRLRGGNDRTAGMGEGGCTTPLSRYCGRARFGWRVVFTRPIPAPLSGMPVEISNAPAAASQGWTGGDPAPPVSPSPKPAMSSRDRPWISRRIFQLRGTAGGASLPQPPSVRQERIGYARCRH